MAVKNIKKDTSLRKAILQAAITGQLISTVVEPVETTETGKQLLDRIIEERNKKLLAEWEKALKKNPKAKKPVPIVASEIDEDEIPFEIPENWCWCRLKDIFFMQAGKNISSSNIIEMQSDENPYPCFGGNGLRGYVSSFNKDGAYPIIGRQGALCGCINIATGKFYATEHAVVVDTFGICNYQWASWFLIALNLNQYATATAQPGLAVNKIETVLIPLPPLSVQNAIVAKLEQVLPLVDAYENAVLQKEELKSTLSDKVKKAILQEAITGKLTEQWRKSAAITENGEQLLARIIKERNAKALSEWEEKVKTNPKAKKPAPVVASEIEEDEIPFEIPESWCWCRLGDICTKLVDGDHNPPAGLPTKTEYIMASSQNINNDSLVDLEKVRYLSKEVFETENERTNAEEGDIFFTSVGTLGRSCVYDGSKKICFQRSVSVIQTKIYNKFLKYCLDSPFIQYFIVDNATGTAQKGIYLNQLAKLVIPLPPLEEQEEIVKKVEELLPLCISVIK